MRQAPLWPRRSSTVARWARWDNATSNIFRTIGIGALCFFLIAKIFSGRDASSDLQQYRTTPIDFDRLMQISDEAQPQISQARNQIHETEIKDRIRQKLCAAIPGGQVVRWKGYLYDLKFWWGDALPEFMAGQKDRLIHLKSTAISRDSPLYRQLASFKVSTWRTQGDPVVVSGYIEPAVERPPCVGLSGYTITVTDLR